MQLIPFLSGVLWCIGPTFSQGERAVPVVGSCWLQSTLLQVPRQLRVVGVVGSKVEAGAAAKHNRLSRAVQVEHRAHCGAAGVCGGAGGGEGQEKVGGRGSVGGGGGRVCVSGGGGELGGWE